MPSCLFLANLTLRYLVPPTTPSHKWWAAVKAACSAVIWVTVSPVPGSSPPPWHVLSVPGSCSTPCDVWPLLFGSSLHLCSCLFLLAPVAFLCGLALSSAACTCLPEDATACFLLPLGQCDVQCLRTPQLTPAWGRCPAVLLLFCVPGRATTQCLPHTSPRCVFPAVWCALPSPPCARRVSVIYSLQPASPPPASLPPLPSTQLCWVVCLLGESVIFHIIYFMWSVFLVCVAPLWRQISPRATPAVLHGVLPFLSLAVLCLQCYDWLCLAAILCVLPALTCDWFRHLPLATDWLFHIQCVYMLLWGVYTCVIAVFSILLFAIPLAHLFYEFSLIFEVIQCSFCFSFCFVFDLDLCSRPPPLSLCDLEISQLSLTLIFVFFLYICLPMP